MTEGTPIPTWDEQCSLMSLPLACGIDSLQKIPASAPYLSSMPELQALWRQRLQELAPIKPSKRIGLVWVGNGITDVDHDRSLSLSQFDLLVDVARRHGLQFVSLQKGSPSKGKAALDLVDLTAELNDWADTAALIANLDLVISCDTGVAHLAATMGKPTWILSRHNGCWRWLLNRTDSPWYPSVRLFRQPTFGDWATVMQEVAIALAAQSQPHL
jgi:ADP-heptose:LPS heptosyltransferase